MLLPLPESLLRYKEALLLVYYIKKVAILC